MNPAGDRTEQSNSPVEISHSAGTWRPLFEGDEAAELRTIADDIAVAVASRPVSGDGASLAHGNAGLAVHFAVRHSLVGADADRIHALNHLGAAFENAGARVMSPALFGGLAGIGWAGQTVQALLPDAGGEDVVAELDEPLAAYAAGNPPEGDYDLVKGLVGVGCYFLARLPRPAAVRGLEAVVDYLALTAEPADGGLTWFTPPGVLGTDGRSAAPEGYHNVGLAHGVPGIVALLGETVAAGVAVDRAAGLLAKAYDWVLAQEVLSGALRFPAWRDAATGRGASTRLAWCYGDLGVAAALLNAARRTENETLAARALAIGRRVAAVRGRDAHVTDAGLCHGAVGVGHVFNRLYQASGESVFADAARHWFRRALDLRTTGQGIAGFRAHFPRIDPDQPWFEQPGLLTGAAGIALGFLAATSDREPVWDRHLLIAVPPRPGVIGAQVSPAASAIGAVP